MVSVTYLISVSKQGCVLKVNRSGRKRTTGKRGTDVLTEDGGVENDPRDIGDE
jgi:hypothetical protein